MQTNRAPRYVFYPRVIFGGTTTITQSSGNNWMAKQLAGATMSIKLNTTQMMALYGRQNGSSTYIPYGLIYTCTATSTPVANTTYTMTDAYDTTVTGAVAVATNKVFWIWKNASGVQAKVLNTSGVTITQGTTYTFASLSSPIEDKYFCVPLSATRVLVFWQDSSYVIKCQLFNIATNVITLVGSETSVISHYTYASSKMRILLSWDGRVSVFAGPYQAFVSVSGDVTTVSATNSPDPVGYFGTSYLYDVHQVDIDKFMVFFDISGVTYYSLFRFVGDVMKMYWTGTWATPATWVSIVQFVYNFSVNRAPLISSWATGKCFAVGTNTGYGNTVLSYGFDYQAPKNYYGPGSIDFSYSGQSDSQDCIKIHPMSTAFAMVESYGTTYSRYNITPVRSQ
jgi:hypothetical protein